MKKLMFFLVIVMFTVAAACDGSDDSGGGGDDTVINIAEIPGATAPELGNLPVTVITETEQYTGTVSWDGSWDWSPYFAGNKAYTATITLTPKSGYILTGVEADFFTVSGAVSVSNIADSGVVTAVFPATDSVSVGDSACGGKIVHILGADHPAYVAGEQRGLVAADADQSTGIIWAVAAYQSTAVPGGTNYELGDGSDSTDNIIAQNGAGSTYAAGLARAYNGGGYTDWFLPSLGELDLVYNVRASIGGFDVDVYYWSSNEYSDDPGQAWRKYFGSSSGPKSTISKSNMCKVRSVRYF